MTVLTEENYLGDVLKWELENNQSVETITIAEGETLDLGAVVGKITKSTPTTGTAGGSNTGNGTCTAVTSGSGTKIGTYTLTCITAATNLGDFKVVDPDGFALPDAVAETAYTNDQLNFIINDGATDYAVGDIFTITVAAGSDEIVEIEFAAVDGSEDAYGVLIADYSNAAKTNWAVATAYALHDIVVPTTSNSHMYKCVSAGTSHAATEPTWPTDGSEVVDATCTWVDQGLIPAVEGVAIVRDAQVVEENLVWPTGATADQKAAAMVQLKAKSIVTRKEV